MKTLTQNLVALLIFLLFQLGLSIGFLNAQTTIQGGDVHGVWTYANSPYLIDDEINVPDSQTLVIQPGVEVIFTDYISFAVYGRLLAIGSPDSMITFTAEDTTDGWMGIEFRDIPANNDSSKLVYCKVSRAKNPDAINNPGGRGVGIINSDRILIAHCQITHNIMVGDKSTGGAGIGVRNSSPLITHNFIAYNRAVGGHGGGIVINNDSAPGMMLVNNIFFKNHASGGAGIASAGGSKPFMINNTIADNWGGHGAGVDFVFGSGVLINCIVYGNISYDHGEQIHFGYSNEPDFYNCLIEGGKENFSANHRKGAPLFSGAYENCIDADPQFVDPGADFHLKDSSPCIGMGLLTDTLYGKIIHAPTTDFALHARPMPAGSMPDLGAYENLLGMPAMSLLNPILRPDQASLLPLYPNPTSGELSIPYQLHRAGQVNIEIGDMQGKTVQQLKHTYHIPGEYIEVLDVGSLPDGVYRCTLWVDGSVESRIFVVRR